MKKYAIKAAFRQQRFHAKKRGIEWNLSFNEWVSWWHTHLDSDWFEKRGRKNGQYQMSRNGDCGPYAVGNISCKTREQNVQDAIFNHRTLKGEKNHNSKLTESSVREIRKDNRLGTVIATDYQISKGVIYKIKSGKSWSHVE